MARAMPGEGATLVSSMVSRAVTPEDEMEDSCDNVVVD